MTAVDLPRWSVDDVHAGFEARSFTDAMERSSADLTRLVALFDEFDIRAVPSRATDTRNETAQARGRIDDDESLASTLP